MPQSPIFWLNFLKNVNRNIDCHYILKLKNNFMVFTSKPVPRLECALVSNTNIIGKNKPQYLAQNIHKFDPEVHKITQPQECIIFYENVKIELKPQEFKLLEEHYIQIVSEITTQIHQ